MVASYLDTSKTYGLTLKVYDAEWGSFWDAFLTFNTGEWEVYFNCLADNLYNQASCNYQPGQLIEEHTLSYSNPSINLQVPAGNYLLQVEQLQDPNNPQSAFAKAASFVTLESGNNAVVINLLYGSWQFTSPLDLQLLDATFANQFPASLPIGISGTDRLTSADYSTLGSEDWSQDLYSPISETIAEGLGLSLDTSEVQLKAIHLNGNEQLRGYTAQPLLNGVSSEDKSLYYGSRTLGGNLFHWGQAFIPYQSLTLETLDGNFLGTGWKKHPQITTGIYQSGGIEAPAIFAQEFDGSNSNWLDLGHIATQPYLPNGSLSPPYTYKNAGIFFLTADHPDYQVFNPGFTPGSSNQGSNYFTVQSHDGSGGVTLTAEAQNFWVDADFPSGHFPLTQMVSANEIRGTLVEYVTYDQSLTSLDPELMSTNADLPTSLPSLNVGAHTYPDGHPLCEQGAFGGISPIKCELRAADTQAVTTLASGSGCFTFENRHQWASANYDTSTFQYLSGFTQTGIWQAQLVRVCLHPFTMTAGPQGNPDLYQTATEQLAALTLDKAGQLAFEALDVNGNPKQNKELLSQIFIETLSHYANGATGEWCASGNSSINLPVGTATGAPPWVADITYENCQVPTALLNLYDISCPDINESLLCDTYSGQVQLRGRIENPSSLTSITADIHVQTQDLKTSFYGGVTRNFSGIDYTGFHYQADYDIRQEYFSTPPLTTDLAGNYFQFEMISADPAVEPLGVGYQHFNLDLNSGTGEPIYPEYYLSLDFMPGAVRVSTDSALSYLGGQPDGGSARIEGLNGTWMTATANGDYTYNLIGEFDDKPGEECTLNNVNFSDLDSDSTNPVTAADFTCTAL
ncbi:hypothetical protein [Marinospirillum perlucidum]|uniref:hypothetical protein n=1 Tax=Marinospirillum perlucidum TaxID=1982602 RepID=UPI00138FE74F|nr:hypothetical protein [Marinospirillum perlucidum]